MRGWECVSYPILQCFREQKMYSAHRSASIRPEADVSLFVYLCQQILFTSNAGCSDIWSARTSENISANDNPLHPSESSRWAPAWHEGGKMLPTRARQTFLCLVLFVVLQIEGLPPTPVKKTEWVIEVLENYRVPTQSAAAGRTYSHFRYPRGFCGAVRITWLGRASLPTLSTSSQWIPKIFLPSSRSLRNFLFLAFSISLSRSHLFRFFTRVSRTRVKSHYRILSLSLSAGGRHSVLRNELVARFLASL